MPAATPHAIRIAAELEHRKRYGTSAMVGSGPKKVMKPREPRQRAAYATDPFAYARDIFGYHLTPQEEDVLALMYYQTRLLIPSANNIGKTYCLAVFACYTVDAVGAVLDSNTGRQQGARVLLPGPDRQTIFETVYSQMLIHARVAESRGWAMPGWRSENSVLWRVEPTWGVEAFSPPRKVNQQVAHTASGRHHRIQVALIEEGQGVGETVWAATEGMCSSEGNKIISSFNPTEAHGPAYQRARDGNYTVIHLDAFDHPNVRERAPIVEGAISYRVVDDRVRSQCRDRGRYPAVMPDVDFGDFVYALPSPLWPEKGPREDGELGHVDAELHTYRPTGNFEAQVRGQWPRSSDTGLFSQGAWDQAVARWKAGKDPLARPSRIGVDAAREGDDDCCYAPAWGADASDLLRRWAQAESDGDVFLLQSMKEKERARVGEIQVAPKGDGPDVAKHIASRYADIPWNVDAGGVGASVYDHANRVLHVQAAPVSFAGAPPEDKIPEEPYALNVRALLYLRAARLVNLGLVDVPDDSLLREEILAHEVRKSRKDGSDMTRTVTVIDSNGRQVQRAMPVQRILEKEEIKKRIGRSPDRADAFVLALWGVPQLAKVLIGRA